MIEEQEKSSEQFKEIKQALRPYTTEVTRVTNKRYAPPGYIFFVIKAKDKSHKYSSSIMVKLGYTEEEETKLFELMWQQISKKYNL